MASTEIELWRAHEGLASAAAARRHRRESDPHALLVALTRNGGVIESAQDDPTPVPAGLQSALQAISERLGYPVRLTSQSRVAELAMSSGSIGLTVHRAGPDVPRYLRDMLPPHGMYLTETMTPASLARTTCHELTHVISQNRLPEELEEPVAESVAGIVAGALRFADGKFSVGYLANHDPSDVSAAREYAVPIAQVILTELEHVRAQDLAFGLA